MNYFTDDRESSRREALSPSGNYRLLVRHYTVGPGYWDYTRGTVYRVSDGAEVADVKRCYSSFWHLFVTRGETEYLLCGRSYMGQTLVNLSTGNEMNDPAFYKKREDGSTGEFGNYEGHEFCWVSAQMFDERTIHAHGCVWGGVFEHRFYDFTDPEKKGWPQLACDVSITDDDFDLDEDDEEEYKEKVEGGRITFASSDYSVTLHRDGDRMAATVWESEHRIAKRKKEEREAEEERERVELAQRESPLYQWVMSQSADGLERRSRSWCGEGEPARFNIYLARLVSERRQPSAMIRWSDGEPIRVDAWTFGVGSKVTEFENSQAGMERAHQRAVDHVLDRGFVDKVVDAVRRVLT